MSSHRWTKRALLAVVWALAASTWASIGHHLMGLPDIGVFAPALGAAVALAWPIRASRRSPQPATATATN